MQDRRRYETSHGSLQGVEELVRRRFRGVEELAREHKVGAVEALGGGGTARLPGGGAEAKEDPGQVVEPGGSSQA